MVFFKSSYCLMVLLCTCCSMLSFGQNALEHVATPPSPTASSLGKFADMPVGLYTGTPRISVPIFEVKENTLSVPVSLDYHAGGVKLEENASWVGLAWALNAGGVITRAMRSIPDEGGFGYLGWLDQTYAIPEEAPVLLNDREGAYWSATTTGTLDTEPDIFYFNFAGRTGKFFLDHDGVPHVVPFQKIKIIPANTPSQFASWTIITEDGTSYTFSKVERTTTYTYSNGNARDSKPPYRSAWYLTQVTSANGTATISLTYEDHGGFDFPYYYINTSSFTEYEALMGGGRGDEECVSLTMIGTPARLETISSSTMQVRFIRGAGRCDLKGDYMLDSIRISRINVDGTFTILRKFALNYKYMENGNLVDISTPCVATPNMVYNTGINYERRLMLMSVAEVGADGLRGGEHRFEYFLRDSTNKGMPSRLSFNQDHWGYYNSAQNDGIHKLIPASGQWNGADREARLSGCRVGAISKITYPTKGYSEFVYQLHAAYNAVLPFTRVVNRDASLGIQYHLQTTGKKTVSDPFVINSSVPPTRVQLHYGFPWQDANARPCQTLSFNPFRQGMFRYEIWKYNGTDSTFIKKFDNVDDFTTVSLDLENGTYKIIHTVLANTYLQNMCTPYSFGFSWNQMISGNEMKAIGGLRIFRVTEASSEVKKIRRYEYLREDGQSSGTLMNFPNYEYPYEENTTMCPPENPLCGNYGSYRVHTSSTTLPLGTTQGSPVGYGRVTEYHGENLTPPRSVGLNGKTVHTFTDALLHPDLASVYGAAIPSWGVLDRFPYAPIDSYDWARGMELTTTDFAFVGGVYEKRRELINAYTFYKTPGDRNYTEIFSWKVGVQKRAKDYFGPISWLVATRFKIRSGYSELTQKQETVYPTSGAGAPLTTVTDYVYSADHLQLTEQRITESSGAVLKMKLKYPSDFSASTVHADSASVALAKLVIQNRLNKPVEQKIFLNDALVKGSFTKFRELNPGKIFDYEFYVYRTVKPVTDAPESSVSGGQVQIELFQNNRGYEKVATNKEYNNKGNLLFYKKSPIGYGAYLWDHSGTVLIAEAANALASDIAYTSFEGDGTGTWSIASPSRSLGGITGQKSYSLASGGLAKTGLSTGATYLISFWAKNGVPTLDVGAAVAGRTKDGWTFYRKVFTQATGVTISGTGLIDELKLQPANAFMKTYAHLPGVGLSSKSDENDYMEYYEYDTLGRLKFVRNGKGEIVRKIEYNYQVQ